MMPNMGEFMKRAEKLQKQLSQAQAELAKKEYEATAGGDLVRVVINGKLELKKVQLAAEVVDPEDIELLEDLVLSAVNAAIKKANEQAANNMQGLTKGLKLPPGLGL